METPFFFFDHNTLYRTATNERNSYQSAAVAFPRHIKVKKVNARVEQKRNIYGGALRGGRSTRALTETLSYSGGIEGGRFKMH